MKFINVLIPILLLTSCKPKASATQNAVDGVQTEQKIAVMNKILSDLDILIENSSNKNQAIEEKWKFVFDKVCNGSIKLKYDTALHYGFVGCASSSYLEGDSSSCTFSFGRFIIDAYEFCPTLVQSIVIHEFQHLSDMTTNRKAIEISENNPIEKTYFEIDALYLESLFIKTYAIERQNLSPVESYILSDDNLLGSSALFEMVDLDLLHQMDDLKSKNVPFASGEKELVEIGNELLKTTHFSKEMGSWKNYCNAVKLKTYIYFSKQVLHDLLFILANKSYSDVELDMKAYPELFDKVTALQNTLDKNHKYLAYQDSLIKKYDDIIKSKLKSRD